MANREENNSQKNPVQHHKRQNIQSSQHILRRRQPRKIEQGENIFYVSTKTNTKVGNYSSFFTVNKITEILLSSFQAHLERCNKLIRNKNVNEIIIYCLGAAIQRGILLALQLCEEHVAFDVETSTFSTELIGKLSFEILENTLVKMFIYYTFFGRSLLIIFDRRFQHENSKIINTEVFHSLLF